MKISLAMATYNGQKFIEAQLESLLKQTRKPDEVIIIDDCSSDNTAEVVTAFIEKNNLDWQFEVASENSGYICNFRNCLKKTTGDIVFLCDQDDEWAEEKIEKISRAFEENPEAMGVNSSFVLTNALGEPLDINPPKKGTSNNGLILFEVERGGVTSIDTETVLMYNISPGCTCAFKQEIVREYTVRSECKLPHDWELNILAAEKNGLLYLDIPLMGYRQHGGNAIGLSRDENNSLKMRGSENDRIKNFKIQEAQLETIELYSKNPSADFSRFTSALRRFCQNRRRILFDYKVSPCFENLFLYFKVKRVATIMPRGLVGDFIYVLKKRFSGGKK